jgi:hypothetical protein
MSITTSSGFHDSPPLAWISKLILRLFGMEVVSGQLSVVSGQLSVVSCQLSVGSCQSPVVFATDH